MTNSGSLTDNYVRKILTIVFLTIIAAVLFLPTRFGQATGWIAGSVGSGLNFYWLYRRIKRSIVVTDKGALLNSYKGFYLRFFFLALYSVVVVFLLRPDIIMFGIGLVSVQIVIYLHYFYSLLRPEKKDIEDEES